MSQVTPHIKDEYAPLNELIKRAVRRFGDFGAAATSGDVEMMFIEFANLIVDDYKTHPYYDGRTVDYYTSSTDCRPIHDNIMLQGMIAHYSFQQASEKTGGYQTMYYRTLNQLMWDNLNGNTPINLRPTDGGSNKAHSVITNPINGLEIEDEDGID